MAMLKHIGLVFTTALTLMVVSKSKAATMEEILRVNWNKQSLPGLKRLIPDQKAARQFAIDVRLKEPHTESEDIYIGMDCPITRRDFLNGVAISVGGTLASAWLPGLAFGDQAPSPAAQDTPGYYPPALTGMRGSHPRSFEVAHSLRDGTFWDTAGKPVETGENYDLVGGFSGLAAAYFYLKHAGAR
jgi:hypothetical protein